MSTGIRHGDGLTAAIEYLSVDSQFGLDALAFAPDRCLAKLALYGRYQTCQIVLQQVVMCATLHHAHGDILANAARNNDKGDIEAGFLQDIQRTRCIELRQHIV